MLLETYNADWIKHFTDIKREIDIAFDGIEYRVEHVGSTSVPKLDAKPIIDIDIVFLNLNDFEKIKDRLETIGYFHNGNQGILDREVFKRHKNLNHKILDTIYHHLYVCSVNSKALERHILSRNFLRKNDWARTRYQNMKYEMAEKANQDRKKYQELKELNINHFIDSIIELEKKQCQTSIWKYSD